MYVPCVGDTDLNSADERQPKVDWDWTRRSGDIDVFETEVRNRLQSLLNSTFHNIEQLD